MNFSKHFLSLRDYFLTQETFELWLDEASGLLKTMPQPEKLDRYYESENYLSHDDNKVTFFAKCYNTVKIFNLRSKTKTIMPFVKNGRVLDIGAGTGDLVDALNKVGVNAIGYEPSERARAAALHKGTHLLKEYPQEVKQFQVITMYHVLEHVANVEEQLKRVYDLLESRGTLILALPNYESLDAKIFKKYWAGYDVPRHLYHFNRNAVVYVSGKYFEIVKTQPMWFDSFYVSILSAQYKKLPMAFVIGSLVGFLSNVAVIFTKQPSSITYILQKRN